MNSFFEHYFIGIQSFGRLLLLIVAIAACALLAGGVSRTILCNRCSLYLMRTGWAAVLVLFAVVCLFHFPEKMAVEPDFGTLQRFGENGGVIDAEKSIASFEWELHKARLMLQDLEGLLAAISIALFVSAWIELLNAIRDRVSSGRFSLFWMALGGIFILNESMRYCIRGVIG